MSDYVVNLTGLIMIYLRKQNEEVESGKIDIFSYYWKLNKNIRMIENNLIYFF